MKSTCRPQEDHVNAASGKGKGAFANCERYKTLQSTYRLRGMEIRKLLKHHSETTEKLWSYMLSSRQSAGSQNPQLQLHPSLAHPYPLQPSEATSPASGAVGPLCSHLYQLTAVGNAPVRAYPSVTTHQTGLFIVSAARKNAADFAHLQVFAKPR